MLLTLPHGAASARLLQGTWCLRTLGLSSHAQQRLLNCTGLWNFLPLTLDCAPLYLLWKSPLDTVV